MRANERRVASRNERDWMDSAVARIWTFSVFFLLFLYLHVSCAVEKLSTFCVCDIVFGRLLIKFEISSRTPAHSVLHKQQEIAFAPITHSFQMSECQIIDRVSPIQSFCYTERNCFSLSLRVNEDRIEKNTSSVHSVRKLWFWLIAFRAHISKAQNNDDIVGGDDVCVACPDLRHLITISPIIIKSINNFNILRFRLILVQVHGSSAPQTRNWSESRRK